MAPPEAIHTDMKGDLHVDLEVLEKLGYKVPWEATWTGDEGKEYVHLGVLEILSRTRALQIEPRFELVTSIIALDCEFQKVYVEALRKHQHRVGRISIVNYFGQIIYDVFAYYDEEPGKTIALPPADLNLGVYWRDLWPENGARPISEVENNVRNILRRAKIVVGHAIANDIKVFSEGVFDRVAVRDTQLHEPWRKEYGKAPQHLPKLAVLACYLLRKHIQGDEHSSVEDARATMLLFRKDEAAIEAAQGRRCDGFPMKVERKSIEGATIQNATKPVAACPFRAAQETLDCAYHHLDESESGYRFDDMHDERDVASDDDGVDTEQLPV
ncbi:hypothetical protein LTR48_002541 [Friedmanniomyces endolithicus]|uniref:3'-5' exonuclease n=1 Tax=Rachicladosporium monterosium TaxID=1507873 RepID=A0ABR0LAN3_9PEZI|nr:hypothetical protein LTR48_002541 [Friedmanniomyces endolithicus]KAK5146057.1 3'-5' exonuclease [Rachicladosporium monterosium]